MHSWPIMIRCIGNEACQDLADDARLALADPVTLIQGFRYLQQRIPGFTQLSAGEERSLIRVSTLDPGFIIGLSGQDRHWDEVESEVRAASIST